MGTGSGLLSECVQLYCDTGGVTVAEEGDVQGLLLPVSGEDGGYSQDFRDLGWKGCSLPPVILVFESKGGR